MGFILEIFGGAGGKSDKELSDPNMTLHDGKPECDCDCPIRRHNMKRIAEDAKLRSNPANGHVYAGFKSLQYRKQKKED